MNGTKLKFLSRFLILFTCWIGSTHSSKAQTFEELLSPPSEREKMRQEREARNTQQNQESETVTPTFEFPVPASPPEPPQDTTPSVKPDTQAPTEVPELPQLPVDSLDPTPHLPSFPKWIPFFIAILVLSILCGLGFLLAKLMRKKAVKGTYENPLIPAQKEMAALQELPATTPLATISTQASLIIRRYLASARADRALYQTHEEFEDNDEALNSLPSSARQQVSEFLTELSNLKYSPPELNESALRELSHRGEKILQTCADAVKETQDALKTHA